MSGLEQEFPGRVVAKNVDATTPENEAQVQSLGFKRHGLVVRTRSGEVWLKQPDHDVDVETVRNELRKRLEGG